MGWIRWVSFSSEEDLVLVHRVKPRTHTCRFLDNRTFIFWWMLDSCWKGKSILTIRKFSYNRILHQKWRKVLNQMKIILTTQKSDDVFTSDKNFSLHIQFCRPKKSISAVESTILTVPKLEDRSLYENSHMKCVSCIWAFRQNSVKIEKTSSS